jgi:hypothetical protein
MSYSIEICLTTYRFQESDLRSLCKRIVFFLAYNNTRITYTTTFGVRQKNIRLNCGLK